MNGTRLTRRWAATALLAAVILGGCGSKSRQLTLAPPVRADSSAFVGWWFMTRAHSAQCDCFVVHVFKRGGSLQGSLEGGTPRTLSRSGDLLVAPPTSGDSRSLRLWLAADGRLQLARSGLNEGEYARGTHVRVCDEITGLNAGILESAIEAWFTKHGSLPTVAQVRPGSGAFARSVAPAWPVNPFTGKQMSVGHRPGDFRYHYSAHLWSMHWVDAYGHEDISESSY